jgi:HEPN domain-containing protein/predicted nucleotidyltransferase
MCRVANEAQSGTDLGSDEVARIRNLLCVGIFSFRIVSAAVFGSAAVGRATRHSDIDLLVVSANLPHQRHRRSALIAEIKRSLPGVPLDVLLLTPAEVESNFTNHNPLFLDIAEDALVLVDSDGALRQGIERTRQYVRERGIVRTATGWRFPVVAGAPTLLSNVSNRDFAQAMLDDAGRDRQIGDVLRDDSFYDKAVYHYQQAVEKAVKAILIAVGVFEKTHFVGTLLRKVTQENPVVPDSWRSRLQRAAAISEELEPDVSLSRYPGIIQNQLWLPRAEYSADRALEAGALAQEALDSATAFVDDWFTPRQGPEGPADDKK